MEAMNRPMNKYAKKINEFLRQETKALEQTFNNTTYQVKQEDFLKGIRLARNAVMRNIRWFPSIRHQMTLSKLYGSSIGNVSNQVLAGIQAASYKINSL